MKKYLILLTPILLFSVFLFPAHSNAAITDGLIGYWTFDEGSGTAAGDSAGSNTGTLTNGSAWATGASAKIGSGALQFDGVDDYVDASHISQLESGDMTFSFWVNFNSLSGMQWLVRQWTSTGNGPTLFMNGNDLNFEIGSYAGKLIVPNAFTSTNRWYHMVATAQGTTFSVYINGVLTQGSGTRVESNSTEHFRIGGPAESGIGVFNGSIDDVRVYNRVLSATEITQLYNLGSGGTTSTGSGTVTPPANPQTCTSFTYSWGTCTNGTQTGTVTSSSPAGCTGGSPVTTQSCVVAGQINPSGNSTTYRVRKDGTGDFTTIQQAVNQAKPGDTVIVYNGDYSVTEPPFTSVMSGTADKPITIQAANGEIVTIARAVISHDYIRVEGFRIVKSIGYYASGIGLLGNYNLVKGNTFIGSGGLDYAMYITGSNNSIEGNIFDGLNDANHRYFIVFAINGSNNLVSNNTIKNIMNTERIFDLYGSRNVIRGNEIYGLTWLNDPGVHSDIFQTVPGNISKDHIIESNYFHDDDVQIGNIEADIDATQVNGWIFRNNIFANIQHSFFISGKNLQFYNNTFYRVGSVENMAFVLYNFPLAGGNASGFTMKNNIIIGNSTSDYSGWWGIGSGVVSGIITTNNYISKPDYTLRSGFSSGNDNINGGDIGFVAAYTNCVQNACDFHLKSNSVLIGKGANLSALWSNAKDKDGNSRPVSTWTIGAYEYTGAIANPPVNPPPTTYAPGDFNQDRIVNVVDLSTLTRYWNQSNSTYDLNGDGIVNSLDYVIMVQHWTP